MGGNASPEVVKNGNRLGLQGYDTSRKAFLADRIHGSQPRKEGEPGWV